MTNKVRISYTVPLTEVPLEAQGLSNRIHASCESASEILNSIEFVQDFAASHEKLKTTALLLDRAQTMVLDALSIVDGFVEIQNSISTRQETTEQVLEDLISTPDEETEGTND